MSVKYFGDVVVAGVSKLLEYGRLSGAAEGAVAVPLPCPVVVVTVYT